MPNLRRVLFLGLALLLSGGAVLGVQQWMHSELKRGGAPAASAASPTVRVLVVKQAVPVGAILKVDDLRWQDWPKDAADGGYLTSEASSPEKLAGSVARTSLAQGQPLTAGMLIAPGDRSYMAAVLRPGMRAVTINVSVSTGVGGFVFPGDHVDLILTRQSDRTGGRGVSVETVLRDLRVLGMDQRSSNQKNEIVAPQSATLEVSPQQAETVALASELGKLSLSLRSLSDDGGAAPQAETWSPAPKPVAAPAARPAHPPALRPAPASLTPVQVVRGVQASDAADRPGAPS